MSDNTNASILDRFNAIRRRRITALNKPDGLFSRSPIANLLLVAFCAADAVTLYTTWNMLLTESPLMLVLIIAAFVIGLDVTMSIAGNVIKQCSQKLRPMRESVLIVTFCVLAFLGVYVCYFWLRLSMTELTFGAAGAVSSLVDMTGAADTSADTGVTVTAVAASYSMAFLPLVTSLASLAVSAAVSDPLGEKLADLRKQRISLESHLAHLKCELTESETTDAHIRRLYDREYSLFEAFNAEIDRTALSLKLKVRGIIADNLGTSDADIITDMTKDSKRIADEFDAAHSDDDADERLSA